MTCASLTGPKAELQAGFVWLHFYHYSIYHAPPRWLQSCLLTGGAGKQVPCATVSAANSTRSPGQILLSTFPWALLMQIHVNAQDLKALGNTSESNKLIRQESSLSVLADTVKFNNNSPLDSPFKKNLKLASSPQLFSSSAVTHCTLFILCSKSLKAEHFHSWFVWSLLPTLPQALRH